MEPKPIVEFSTHLGILPMNTVTTYRYFEQKQFAVRSILFELYIRRNSSSTSNW